MSGSAGQSAGRSNSTVITAAECYRPVHSAVSFCLISPWNLFCPNFTGVHIHIIAKPEIRNRSFRGTVNFVLNKHMALSVVRNPVIHHGYLIRNVCGSLVRLDSFLHRGIKIPFCIVLHCAGGIIHGKHLLI